MKTMIYCMLCLFFITAAYADDMTDSLSDNMPSMPDAQEMQPDLNPPDVNVDEYLQDDSLMDITISNSDGFSFGAAKPSPKLDDVQDPSTLLDVYGSQLEQTSR